MVDANLIYACSLMFLAIFGNSNLAPFLPLLLEIKGIDNFWAGFFIGTYSVFLLMGSILINYVLPYIGREKAVKIGFISLTLQMLLIGSLQFINSLTAFKLVGMFGECFGGFGVGIAQTVIVQMISTMHADNKEKANTFLQGSGALGFLLGPFFGTFAYQLSFCYIFWSVAIVDLMIMKQIFRTAKELNQQLEE